MPFSYLPPPDYAAFEKIFAGSRLYSPPSVKSAISGYEEKLVKGLKDSETWNDFHVQTLQLLDGMSGTQRLYLTASKIWQSAPFLDFVAAWLSRLPVLTENYNQCLDEYRHKYGITHGFSPLPNLKFEDWWFEIPFWGVNKYQQRHSLWAKNDKKYLILRTQGTGETYPVALDEFRQELAALKITIWPKALPQTLFCRLFLCDYFVHGTGGRAYEEVNDLFIEKTFKSKPPAFGTATATYWVEGDQAGKIDHIVKFEPKMEAWERSLEKNPEYLFTKQEAWKKEMPHFIQEKFNAVLGRPELRALAEEKEKWVEALKDPSRREAASRRIPEINRSLYDQYDEVLFALEAGLLDVNRLREMDQVLTFREYPFFCYSPETFRDMREKIRQSL
jgi:hypothetical protein